MLLKKGVRLHRKHATVITPNLLFTLIALIVMPLVLEFSHFIYLDVLEKYFSQFIKGYDQADNLIFKNSVTASQYYLYYNLFFYLQVAAFILILIVYPPYPFTYSIRRYFEKKGYPAAVAEYEIIKKIVYLAVSVLIFLLILEKLDELDASLHKSFSLPLPIHELTKRIHPHIDYFDYADYLLVLIVSAGLFKMLLTVERKKFRLFFAKRYFITAQNKMNDQSNENDEVEIMGQFVKGFNSYNSYLRKQIKLHIENIDNIYSKIISLPRQVKNGIINDVSKVFIEKELENNTLAPVRCLSALMHLPDDQQLLAQTSIKLEIKDWAKLATIIISLIIAIQKIWLGG